MKSAERESYKMVRETCPDLDSILDDLLEQVADKASEFLDDNLLVERQDLIPMFARAAERIKDKCTKPLREALIDAIQDRYELADELAACVAIDH